MMTFYVRQGVPIGVLGVIHPDVLKSFDIPFPCAAMELDLEVLASAN